MIGDDLRPVEAIERFLAWLSRIERSPNTVRAYAQDLKTFWAFLSARSLDWEAVSLEQLGMFTGWLRQPTGNVVVLHGPPARTTTTVNRILSAVFGFYEYHARSGVSVAAALVDRARQGRGSFKSFLHGIAPAPARGRVGRLRDEQRLPRALSVEQVRAIVAAQTRLRDRFLFALLFGTGMRIGQALGLRHCDFVAHERRVEIVPREDNANGARGKHGRGSVPITSQLVRCHGDYMHVEYGTTDSDYVFVNLWGGRVGRAMTYANVNEIVVRTRRQVGFDFTAHQFRHTYATLARRDGVPLEIVSKILTHGSVQTTSDIYTHATAEDLRTELVNSQWFDGETSR